MCKHCIYDPYAKGAWRVQVTECTSTACPLYHVRPLTKASLAQPDTLVADALDKPHTAD